MATPILTEAVVTTAQAAIEAQHLGLSRIELCTNLEAGGLTPSIGLIETVCEHVDFPIHVLIRPRAGDFCYNKFEQGQMARDVRAAASAGADAIVIGALTSQFQIDTEAMQRFLDAAEGCSITFHRAFDVAAQPEAALQTLLELGVQRLLTSGQQPTALEGAALIKQLISQAGKQLTILPGSGINASNAAQLIEQTGATELHFSAMRAKEMPPNAVAMGKNEISIPGHYEFDTAKAQAMLNAIAAAL